MGSRRSRSMRTEAAMIPRSGANLVSHRGRIRILGVTRFETLTRQDRRYMARTRGIVVGETGSDQLRGRWSFGGQLDRALRG